MEKFRLWLMLLSTIFAGSVLAINDFQPQQVHLAIGDNNSDIVVMWVTPSETNTTVVEYGTSNLGLSVSGTASKFTDGGSQKREMWMHRVVLQKLAANTRYFYHVGGDEGWSGVYTFKTWPSGNNWTVRAAVYGDLGAVNGKSVARIQDDVTKGMYDLVIHVGDFAYNFDTDDAQVGDEFMRQIEPIAAYLPYMTCPGNHEAAYNFSNYRARFSMPLSQKTENMFFSWNAGPAHFISVNTESFYYLEYGTDPLFALWEWLVNDLEEATKPANRAAHPWIIIYGHRPMYCTTKDTDDCRNVNCRTRVGISGNFAMEKLLLSYGVDVAVWAHEHNYERLLPLYNYTILGGSQDQPYTNPRAPVHVISGSAGCQEDTDPFVNNPPAWSAFRSSDYGYARFTIYNATHLYWEQVSDDKDGAVIDSTWVITNAHGPFHQRFPEYYKNI